MVTLTVSKSYEASERNSLASVATAQFALDNLKVQGREPIHQEKGDNYIVLKYPRLAAGDKTLPFDIPGFDREEVSVTIKEGDLEVISLELFEPPGELTLLNESGFALKVVRIKSGTFKKKTVDIDKVISAGVTTNIANVYRQGGYPTGEFKTILVLKRDGYRELEENIEQTPFRITTDLFEGKEEKAVINLGFNGSAITHDPATDFYSFIRDIVKPAVEISVMDDAGQWQLCALDAEIEKNATNSTVVLRYSDVPIGPKAKLQVSITHDHYESFITTNSEAIADKGEWSLNASLECIKPKVTIVPNIETEIGISKDSSYPLRISVQNVAQAGSQAAKFQEIDKRPYEFTLDPFAEYRLVINGAGIAQSTNQLPKYLPGLNANTFPVIVKFEAEKELQWMDLHGRIFAEGLTGAMQAELEQIEKNANENITQALAELQNFYNRYEPLIIAKAFDAKKKLIRTKYFPPEAPKYKNYIDHGGEVKWESFNTVLIDIEKPATDSRDGEERLEKLKAEIEKAYEKVKTVKIMEGETARRAFDNDRVLDEKQLLTKFIEPDWYKENFKLPTKEQLESDPLEYLKNLRKAEVELEKASHNALNKEIKAYKKGIKELKEELDKLRGDNTNISENVEKLKEEQVEIQKFLNKNLDEDPNKESLHNWVDKEIRIPCKQIYQKLIMGEIALIEQKREIDRPAFDLLLKDKLVNIKRVLEQMESSAQSLYEEPEAYKELRQLRLSYSTYIEGYLKKVFEKTRQPDADLKEVWRLYEETINHFPNRAGNFDWGSSLQVEVVLAEGNGDSEATEIRIPDDANAVKFVVQVGVNRVVLGVGDGQLEKALVAPGRHLVEISYTMSDEFKRVEYATHMEMQGPLLKLNLIKGPILRPTTTGPFKPFGRINVTGKSGRYFRPAKDRALTILSFRPNIWFKDLDKADYVEIDVNGNDLGATVDSVEGNTVFLKFLDPNDKAALEIKGNDKKLYDTKFKLPVRP